MAQRGIADRLFGLGKAKVKHASKGLPDLGDLLGRLEPGERKALERAAKAAARTRQALHGPGLTSPDLLDEVLGVIPGAVTPFAVIYITDYTVKIILDEEMMENRLLNFHPLVNTATTTITSDDLLKFMKHCKQAPEIIRL